MTPADDGQLIPSATPHAGMGTVPSTGIIAVRAASIAGLIFLGTAVLFVVGRAIEPLTVLALSSFATVVCVPLFFGATIVHMLSWRKRSAASGTEVTYGMRVRRLSVTWIAITAVATVSVVAITSWFAAGLDINNDGAWLFALALVGPVLVLGLVGIAAVEYLYERKVRGLAYS